MFIMLQHLCIISHVRELDKHMNAPSELFTFISQKQYRFIPAPQQPMFVLMLIFIWHFGG